MHTQSIKLDFFVNVTEETVQNMVVMIIIFFVHSHAEIVLQRLSERIAQHVIVAPIWVFIWSFRLQLIQRYLCSFDCAHGFTVQFNSMKRNYCFLPVSKWALLFYLCLTFNVLKCFFFLSLSLNDMHYLCPLICLLSFVIWEKIPSLLHAGTIKRTLQVNKETCEKR